MSYLVIFEKLLKFLCNLCDLINYKPSIKPRQSDIPVFFYCVHILLVPLVRNCWEVAWLSVKYWIRLKSTWSSERVTSWSPFGSTQCHKFCHPELVWAIVFQGKTIELGSMLYCWSVGSWINLCRMWPNFLWSLTKWPGCGAKIPLEFLAGCKIDL